MPELPEVESLAAFLRTHASGHVIARAEAASFAVLKTFDPRSAGSPSATSRGTASSSTCPAVICTW
jgi:formamidopyrimidine-DNA glycosylase